MLLSAVRLRVGGQLGDRVVIVAADGLELRLLELFESSQFDGLAALEQGKSVG